MWKNKLARPYSNINISSAIPSQKWRTNLLALPPIEMGTNWSESTTKQNTIPKEKKHYTTVYFSVMKVVSRFAATQYRFRGVTSTLGNSCDSSQKYFLGMSFLNFPRRYIYTGTHYYFIAMFPESRQTNSQKKRTY
jgi:hypothetical protein